MVGRGWKNTEGHGIKGKIVLNTLLAELWMLETLPERVSKDEEQGKKSLSH